jgi:transcriptional regulator with PAS, ATPase and Fis domain
MRQHKWCGNVRELENFVERIVTLAPQEMKTIDVKILPPEFKKELHKLEISNEEPEIERSLEEIITEYEKKVVRHALINNDWNQSKAARALRVSEQTIRYKIRKFDIKKPGG